MIDIKCRGFGCPIRERCRRYTEPANAMQQMYYFPTPNRGDVCSHFVVADKAPQAADPVAKKAARKPAKRKR
jgi:hypothetical protein